MNYLKKHSDFVFFSINLIFFGFLYRDYWFTDPVLMRDDLTLLSPFNNLRDFDEYIRLVLNNTILDVQPVRDLSFWMNLQFQKLAGFPFFHVFNFLIFFTSIILFRNLLKLLGFNAGTIYLSLIIYSVHPVMVSATGWISARKHSLALVFILLALLSFLREKKIRYMTLVWFILSALSHQIFILFPLWLFVYFKAKRLPLEKMRFVLLSIAGGFILFLGTYKTFVLGMGNTTYETFSIFENLSRFILSVGRAVSLLFFPVSISGAYDQGNPLNLLGIPLLVIMSALFIKKKAWDSLIWISLGALAYALTVIAFVNDTYLYLPLITLIIAFNYYFTQNPLPIKPVLKNAFLIFAISLLTLKTISASKMWKSDFVLWRYSYENEGSPYTQILLSVYLMPYDQDKGLEFLRAGAKNFDLTSHLEILKFFLTTIYNSNIPLQTKIEVLKECYIDNVIYNSYYGLTLVEGNEAQTQEGISILKRILKPEETYLEGTDGRKIYTGLRYLCENFPGKKVICEELSINSF